MPLTEDEIRAILKQASDYEKPSAAAIEALKLVQAGRGWVSDESVKEIAELLEISPAELDSVATFYSLIHRRPVGRKVIHLCNSVTCWMLGSEDIKEYIGEKLGIGPGETTPDGEYTLLPIVCLGACDKGPVLMIGGQTHFNVDREGLAGIFEHRGED